MISSYLPAILVPIIGIAFPMVAMALFFLYVETDSVIMNAK